MLKKCTFSILFTMLAMAGMSAAATMTPVTPSKDGNCYQIGTAAELYGFAAIVNGTNGNTAEPTACGVLTADITVNENVLTSAGELNTAPAGGFIEWTPIGYSGHPFIGTFDGQGYTISGLYFKNLVDIEVSVGLFGYVGSAEETVSETVSICNVGVEDSYFNAQSAVGGVVGFVENAALDMENVYNAAVVVGASYVGGVVGYVSLYDPMTLNMVNVYNVGSVNGSDDGQAGGLVGEFMEESGESAFTIKNSYNYGNVVGGNPLVGLVELFCEDCDETVSVTNSYYLGSSSSGAYGTAKSADDFSNGTVYAALHSAEDGSVWHWYSGDAYPTFVEKHSVTLHYSATESETIYFAEGAVTPLPTADADGNVFIWYAKSDLTGTKYSEIPATATGDLELYAKVMNLVDGYYEIADADMLFKFAELVNTQNSTYGSAKAKLIADIMVNQNVLGTDNANVNADGSYNNAQAASAFSVWTPIGNNSNPFKGSFNGQGHTISGLYFNNSETDNVGLFGYTSGAVTIDNVGLVDSYFQGGKYVGSIVGYWNKQGTSKLSVKNSYNTGVVKGTDYVGGLVGGNNRSQSFNVENSYNLGSVNGTKYVGGLIGNPGDIKFSYNVGSVTGTSYVGGLAGSGNSIGYSYNAGPVKNGEELGNAMMGYAGDVSGVSSKISNSYYLEGSGADCGPNAFSRNSKEFANGAVALALRSNSSVVTGASIWGQVVGTDKTPTLTGEIRFLLNDNCFEIASEEDLYLFATVVNNGIDPDACGKLTQDIVVNENVLANVNADGSLKDGVNFKEWTPIGNWDNPFQGSFHGQGHTISGLYFNDTDAVDVGLFGDVNGTVTIDSVGLVDSYIMAGSYVGGLVGFARGSLTISDSYNASSVTSYTTFGGLVGAAGSGSSLAISNSYNVGSLNGGGYGGGLVGYANALVVSNSYNAGAIYNSDEKKALVGGITSSVDDASTVTNSFNYGTISYPSNIEVVVDDLVAKGGEGKVTVTNSFTIGESRFDGDGSTKMTSDKFKDGPVFAALHSAEDGEVWRQYENDAYPTFAAKTGTGAPSPMHVATLHLPEKDSVFAYTEGAAGLLPAKLDDGSILIWYKDENLSGETYTKIAATENGDLAFYAKVMKLDSDGYYEIADADMLFKFAELVNTQNSTYRSAKVKLTADIVVNENVLTTASGTSNVNANGEYIGVDKDFRVWTPIGIGNSTNRFQGAFDGQGHTISGLYVNEPQACSGECPNSVNIGLFGAVANATDDGTVFIRNVGVEDSYFAGHSHIGGIVGDFNSEGNLNIENSYSVATIYAANQSGGLAGYIQNTNVKIEDSYSYGDFKCGSNCGALVGSLISANVNVVNSFYLEGVSENWSGDFGTAASIDAFANGTVATLLHGTDAESLWGQNVTGGESHPTFFKGINVEDGPGVIAGGPEMSTITLSYPDATDSSFTYVEGWGASLPEKDKKGDYVIWYDGSGNFYNEISSTVSGNLDLHAVVFKLGNDGFYEIDDVAKLYKFAAIVNGGNGGVNAKLSEDIEVNKNVLATEDGVSKVNSDGTYIGSDSASFREWTPIGYCDEDLNCLPFTGIFDGQGHTISGLYYNDEDAFGVGLFGYVEGDGSTIIKNVGVEDSYFKALDIAGGILGEYGGGNVASIENVYSAAVVVAGEDAWIGIGGVVGSAWDGYLTVTNAYNVGSVIGGSSMGGIVGDIVDCSATIKNSFNYGDVAGDEPLVGSVDGADVSVTNSYYLGSSSSGDYGTVKSSTEFSDGTVFAALHSAEGGEGWLQYAGDDYPTLVAKTGTGAPAPMHVAVLHYSETDSVVNAYTEGETLTLPTEDKDGNAIIGWTASADGTGDVITEIPASATTDLKLYAKVETFKPNAEGYYEIASADDLYKFAEIVNGGNFTAKAKLMNDIVVNQNVLATADGESKVNATTGEYIGATTGLREWTPINNFNGEFDGDGFSISGLYYNNGSENGVGLFGYLLKNGKNASIKNVGVEDSYFKGNSSVGGILGRVEEGSTVNIENVYNAAFVVAEVQFAGGIVGYDYGNKMSVTNAYNIGQVLAPSQPGYAGGIVGRNYSDVESFIKNSYNYGSVSASTNRGEIVGYVDGTTLSVANSYYLADHTGDDGALPASDFENGTVLAALRAGEGGYVWVQAEGDKYPTININASKNANTIVLDWTSAADSTALKDVGYTDGAMVIVKDGKKFYANGAIYEGILSADQVAAIGVDMLHPVSGIKLATVNDKLVATVNGDSDEPLMIPTDVEVSEVVYERVLTKGVYATIMVPFSVPVSSVSGFSFYKFKRVGQTNEGKWAVYVSTVKDSLRANTPYIIVASNNATQITFKLDNYLTLNTTSDVYETTNGNWTMKGVYERKDFLKGDPELGKAYGFAGDTTQVNIRIGRFVRAGDGSYVLPMGVYLVYEEPKMLARPGQMGSSFARINVMPENISVEIEDEEETTVVKHITVAPTFVKSSDRWFDMKGRSLGEKPTAKGTYYHNGQRVIIK